MNGITSRCVSFAQGNKDPYQRVNYPFGLVLGVDEFVDEQCYFLEKEYMHNRALHGCGTVSGLQVSVGEEAGDIEVRVSPGIGIDQYGRLFIVSSRQCASLQAWLDTQELAAGDQTLYVVARYAECETELVPIAGQPCSSSEQLSAPSRIKDFFEIDFALEPPVHMAHDAAINLAEFLHRLRRDPAAGSLAGLGESNRLAAIVGPDFITLPPEEFRVHLNSVVEEITGNVGDRLLLVLPQEVQPLLDDIFTYWLTEVRPTLLPDLITPDRPENSETEPPAAEILLAQLDLILPEEGELVLENIEVDNTIRPYLLHTQLIQELFDVQDLGGEGGAGEPDQPVMDFAIIEDVSLQILSLWVRVPNNIDLVPNQTLFIQRVEADGSLATINFEVSEDQARRNDVGRYFRLRTRVNLNNGDHLLFRFETDSISVETESGRRSLSEVIEETPFTFANYRPEQARILAFHVVERADALDPDQIREIVQELMPPPQPQVPFVTITTLTQSDGEFDFLRGYEMWFHLNGQVDLNEGAIEGFSRQNLRVFVENSPGNVTELPVQFEQIRPNIVLAVPRQSPNQPLPFVRFAFELDTRVAIRAFNPLSRAMEEFNSIRNYMERSQQQLAGHIMLSANGDGESLVIYAREQGRARRVQ